MSLLYPVLAGCAVTSVLGDAAAAAAGTIRQAVSSAPPMIPNIVPNRNPPSAPITDKIDRKITIKPNALEALGKKKDISPISVINPPNNNPITATEPGRNVLKYRLSGTHKIINPLKTVKIAPKKGLVCLHFLNTITRHPDYFLSIFSTVNFMPFILMVSWNR